MESNCVSIFPKVGITTMSSTEALKAGLRGKALKITHYYRDLLWQVLEELAKTDCLQSNYHFE